MTDNQVAEVTELDPAVLFTVGTAKAYHAEDLGDEGHDALIVYGADGEVFDNWDMSEISYQADRHDYPILSEVDLYQGADDSAPWVALVYRRCLSDALAC